MNPSFKLAQSILFRAQQKISLYQVQHKLDYGTWALSGFNLSNAARIQPVLDVEKIIANEQMYIDTIEKRKMAVKPNAKDVAVLFAEAKALNEKRLDVEKRKNENTAKVQEAVKILKAKKIASEEVKEMRLKGRELREEFRVTTNKFNAVNDKLVSLVLSLPNLLDPITPEKECEVLRDMSPPDGVQPWKFPTEPFWRIARPGSLGPQEQFAYGGAAWLELDLAASCQQSLLNEGFLETGNVDFVRRILLEGACLDPNQFLRIRENTAKAGLAHASYLVGGASFPAFLALFAQTVIYGQEALPLKYFVIGRTYTKPSESVQRRTIQSSAVQVFIACKSEEEQEEEYMKLAAFMEKFYSHTIGLSFQTRLLSAAKLRTYEKKKLAFILNEPQKMIGHLTTVGDYVSKRLLCCYSDQYRVPRFLHMITGQFFDLTGFLRPDLPAPAPPSSPVPVPIKTEEGLETPKKILGWRVPPSGSKPASSSTSAAAPAPSEPTDTSTPSDNKEGDKK